MIYVDAMIYKNAILTLSVALLVASSHHAFANERAFQWRVFGSSITVDPKDLNDELEAQGVKKVKSLLGLGFDVTTPLIGRLNVGARFSQRLGYAGEKTESLATDYRVDVKQDAIAALIRLPLIQTQIFFLDIFGAYGGSHTHAKITGSSETGKITKTDSAGWWSGAYGASLGVGYDRFFVAVEGGMETNRIAELQRTGLNGNIETLDFSGPYVALALVFNTTNRFSKKSR
jgi:opacity protein-like surface antigen